METLVKTGTLVVSSSDFKANGFIPLKYTCEGSNISPGLTITDIPKEAKSLTIIMDDPDAPKGPFDHWIVWNINPNDRILENMIPGAEGKNSFGKIGYNGPCPPTGTHHYHFRVYALDKKLEINEGSGRSVVERAMEGHVLAYGELIGLYKN